MAVAGLVAVIALVAGIVMLADHKSSRGAIFVVAAVVAVIVAVFARPRLTHMAILRPRWSLFA
jgi:glucose uptake protein GlcU